MNIINAPTKSLLKDNLVLSFSYTANHSQIMNSNSEGTIHNLGVQIMKLSENLYICYLKYFTYTCTFRCFPLKIKHLIYNVLHVFEFIYICKTIYNQ